MEVLIIVGGVIGGLGVAASAGYCFLFRYMVKSRRGELSNPFQVQYKSHAKVVVYSEKKLKFRTAGTGIFKSRIKKPKENKVTVSSSADGNDAEKAEDNVSISSGLSFKNLHFAQKDKAVVSKMDGFSSGAELKEMIHHLKTRNKYNRKCKPVEAPLVIEEIGEEEIIEEAPTFPDFVPTDSYSLLDDVVPLEKGNYLVEKRMHERTLKKMQMAETGGVDQNCVQVNSGPDPSIIPEPWELEDNVFIQMDDSLVMRTVMIMWDDNKDCGCTAVRTIKPGWYIGMVIAQCERGELNYLMKYDREKTGNLFIDGVIPTKLSLMGVSAYGTRWVLLKKSEVVTAMTHNPEDPEVDVVPVVETPLPR